MRTPTKLTAAMFACCALLGSTVVSASATAATAATAVSCSDTALPVSGPDGPTTVHGRFCLPASTTPDAVQLLVHGGTYNSAYWDIPEEPERNSYQRDMAAHGYATFAMDQLGAGRSGKPLSPQLLLPAAAKAVHEVVGHLRAGHVGGHAFGKVVLVGHSVGSGVVAAEAATYHDVDAVILSGMTHLPAVPVLALGVLFGLQPAFAEPRFLGSDLLYFTTKPGSREWLFYHRENADPGVIAADEATKDQVSVPGMGTVALFGIVLPVTKGIDVPVFQAVGENDVLFCGVLALRDCSTAEKLRAQEAPYYGPGARLSTYVLPGAGHSLALHRNAAAYREATRTWLSGELGLAPEGYHPIG
ncbi:alpha/beta hydrolase [Amycolatopsis sp. YIM 10]|uniref:alpha/beta hydrolase n=1 Tax=Amycolatopsis sp. YIM 10 TaxID=2653857 RepID=UPI0012A90E25|nr:alpha/beta fold hydrolase [Amycolatopsis sp. YIM 10]QFU92178.1 Alpha/beta hydrolase family protein [Amycolatopsis sp. YIM 10]